MADTTAAKATIARVHPLRIYFASIFSTSAVLFSVHSAPGAPSALLPYLQAVKPKGMHWRPFNRIRQL
jgi:hypothetical protein